MDPRLRRTMKALDKLGYTWWMHTQNMPGSRMTDYFPVVRTPTGRLVTSGSVAPRDAAEELAILVGLAHTVATQPKRIEPSPYPWANGIVPLGF